VVAGITKQKFDVVSNPEFLREGCAVGDFMQPDRIVVGTSSAAARTIMGEIYLPFTSQGASLLVMDEASSEMTKYAANSFLAMKITFMNEIANLCERVGADVDNVRLGIGADERIGKRFLQAGIGYGGSCFPKDVMALEKSAQLYDYDFKLLQSVMEVNARQKQRLVEKVVNRYGEDLKGKTFALWGLAFKPDTDDIREAPSLEIIQALLQRGATVRAYDPEAMANVRKLLGDSIAYGDDARSTLKGAHALLIVTEWKEFAAIEPAELKVLKDKTIFDGRNIFALEQMEKTGLHYNSIGRKMIG